MMCFNTCAPQRSNYIEYLRQFDVMVLNILLLNHGKFMLQLLLDGQTAIRLPDCY